MEEWRDIEGFPGYMVSDRGRIRGVRKNILKPVDSGQEYLKVTLTKNGRHIDKRINRLVAQAFIPNPDDLPIVMHLDNDRQNNCVDNLAWGTHSENNYWSFACGRHPITLTDEGREKAYSKRRSSVIAVDINTGEEVYFISQREAARVLGVSQQHIWGVLNGYRRSTGGFRFRYANTRRRAMYD